MLLAKLERNPKIEPRSTSASPRCWSDTGRWWVGGTRRAGRRFDVGEDCQGEPSNTGQFLKPVLGRRAAARKKGIEAAE
jgi:hypothetical protein